MEAKTEALETALATEQNKFQEQAAQQAAEIDALRTALSDAQERERAANEEISSLRARLEQANRAGAAQSTRQMKASFALAALSRAVAQGGPYAQELAAVAEFEPAAPALLEAHAQTGVASDAQLRERFDVAARAALAAAGQAEAGGGFSGLMVRAKSLVSVRPAKPMSGDTPGAVLSRAEHALDQGEVAFALLQLEDLPLPAQEAMADWMAEARARAETIAALDRLQAQLSGEVE